MGTKISYTIAIVFSLLFTYACDKVFLGDEEPDNPVNNFNILWNDYNEMYGPFVVKDIDWDSLYIAYSPLITNTTTDGEFYDVVTNLLFHLNDNHVTLTPVNSNLPRYQSGIMGQLKTFADFKLSVVQNNYLTEWEEYSEALIYGKINDKIGYIHISNITSGTKFYEKAFDKILEYFKNMDGIIIDIRNNSGGIDKESVYIAGRFTNEAKTAFKFRLKNGTKHDNFTPFYEYTLEPTGNSQYLKKVVLLTHRFTISAAETFTLSMKRNSNVTVIGDTTSGAFSDMITRELPNGWIYSLSVGDWRDANGVSYEGIGFPPDITVQNKKTDIEQGKDEVIETAIGIINQQ